MKTRLLSVVILLLTAVHAPTRAQIIITLTPEPLQIPERDFYIDSVDISNLPSKIVGRGKYGFSWRPLVMKGGLQESLAEYFKKALPKEVGQQPVMIRVKRFYLGERTEGPDRAVADILLHFLVPLDSTWIDIFETECRAEKKGGDPTQWHGTTARMALEKCIAEFAEQSRDSLLAVAPRIIETEESVTQKQDSSGPFIAKKHFGRNDSIALNPALKRVRKTNIMNLGWSHGSYGDGGHIVYHEYSDQDTGWIIPYTYKGELMSLKRFGAKGIFYSFGSNLSGLYRFNQGPVFLKMSVGLAVGSEDAEGSRLFLGLEAAQGIMMLPDREGPVLSAELFERRHFGARIYTSDIGFRLALGFKY